MKRNLSVNKNIQQEVQDKRKIDMLVFQLQSPGGVKRQENKFDDNFHIILYFFII